MAQMYYIKVFQNLALWAIQIIYKLVVIIIIILTSISTFLAKNVDIDVITLGIRDERQRKRRRNL